MQYYVIHLNAYIRQFEGILLEARDVAVYSLTVEWFYRIT